MASNINQIAENLGAQVVSRVPAIGGGAIGAARLARIIKALRARFVLGRGQRDRQSSDAD